MPEKKKKPLKKEHFEILLEDMNKKFELVLEGHDVLNKKIEDTAAEAREREEQLAFLINTLNGKVDHLAVELRQEIGGVLTELHETRQELGAKIDKGLERTEDHEVRIIRLEEKVLS